MTNHLHPNQIGAVMDIREALREVSAEIRDMLAGLSWPGPSKIESWATRIDSALASLPAEAQGDGAVAMHRHVPSGDSAPDSCLKCGKPRPHPVHAAPPAVKVPPMKLLGYANPSRIRMTCASKPGGAHLGQVAIYAGESVDPMDIQERESPTWMGEPLPIVSAQKGEG